MESVHEIETSLIDDPSTDLSPLHELKGLDKALQTYRGALTKNLAKLSEIDERISIEKRKLTETEDETEKCIIDVRLSDL